MHQEHSGSFGTNQLSAIAVTCKRKLQLPARCNICYQHFLDPKALQKHVASELEDLALFTLPPASDETDDSEEDIVDERVSRSLSSPGLANSEKQSPPPEAQTKDHNSKNFVDIKLDNRTAPVLRRIRPEGTYSTNDVPEKIGVIDPFEYMLPIKANTYVYELVDRYIHAQLVRRTELPNEVRSLKQARDKMWWPLIRDSKAAISALGWFYKFWCPDHN